MGYLAKWKSLIQPPGFSQKRHVVAQNSLQLPLGGDVSLDQLGLRGASKHFLLTSQEMPEDVVMLGSTCLGWVGFMEGKGFPPQEVRTISLIRLATKGNQMVISPLIRPAISWGGGWHLGGKNM